MKQEFQVTCPFCSVGCRFKILKGLDEVMFSERTQDTIDFDQANPANEGALCPRGHFAYELLSHPQRLGRAYYKTNGQLKPEIAEIIFHKIVADMKSGKSTDPLAILVDPMLSLHDIRALLDFALNNGIKSIDFISPRDRHLFRALLNTPFSYKKLDDIRTVHYLTNILCIGDVFTKQPVLSRPILKAKYAFRKNALYTINSLPTRTSWFSNLHVSHEPHMEPLLLLYLFIQIYESMEEQKTDEELVRFRNFIWENMEVAFDKYITVSQQESLKKIASALGTPQKSAIFYSTHLYNAAGGFLSGLACSAISVLTDNYFIPLYSDGNMNAAEELSKELYKSLNIGRRSLMHEILHKPYQYIFAAGWNPGKVIPGNLAWPNSTRWLISSLVRSDFPPNTQAVFPQCHIYEQMDLRTNFLAWQSLGSQPVKKPIGSAQSISHFIYQFQQELTEQRLSLSSDDVEIPEEKWDEKAGAELSYYLEQLDEMQNADGKWVVPTDHVAHYRDGELTRLASWAQRDCMDSLMQIPPDDARAAGVQNGQILGIEKDEMQESFKAEFNNTLPPNVLVPYSHYRPVNQLMDGQFAAHNLEYYFFCPRVQVKIGNGQGLED